MKLRIAAAWVTVAFVAWVGGCSDSHGPGNTGTTVTDPLNVSKPVQSTALAPRSAAVAGAAAATATDLAYVSITPGAYPGATVAQVSDARTGNTIFAAMADGGLDPLPFIARGGDVLNFTLTGAQNASFSRVVPLRSSPSVVRTYPPPRKRDVALNSAIILAFSEPIDKNSLTGDAVRLFRGTSRVAGTLSLLQGTGSYAAFSATAPLNPNADYQLVVTQAIRDLNGDPLAAGITLDFTTGESSTQPPASISVSLLTGPDTVLNLPVGTTYPLTATVRDAAGNILIDQPVQWSSSDPNVLTVSQSGVMTALRAGFTMVTASVGGLNARVFVDVTPGPPASVTVSPTPATVAALDTILLTATVRDAAGFVINYPSVTWTSNAPAVATAAPYDAGTPGATVGTVTGVSPGGVTITATSGAASGTGAVTVGPAVPVASVTVTPASARLVIPGTVQLAVTLRDANGKLLYPRPTTWTSDNTAVARVAATGLVTAVGAGSATVTATREGLSGSAAITVDAPVFAFLSERDGNGGVYVMNADGSAVARLFLSPTSYAYELAWSPNGQKIAFIALDYLNGGYDIYVTNVDGNSPTRLTNTPYNTPAWSSDGQKMAFVSWDYEIYVMNADGSAQTRLTSSGTNYGPAWSHDGQKIAFLSTRDGNSEIYVMNADGSAQTNLTNNAADDFAPTWSPDGQKIAFLSVRDGNYEIYVMNADGGAQTRLTNNAADDFAPTWSPDGQKIAFQSNRDGNSEIYVMNADGSAQANLTNNAANDVAPAWSPDGQKIAFVSYRDGNGEIYVMNADGSASTRLTNNAASDLQPLWRP